MRFLLIPLLLAIASCSGYVPTFYKLDVRQGNIIEQEQVARLQVGMNKQQVQALLGSPPITDPFHQDRWDYVYIYYPSGDKGEGEQRSLTLYFQGDQLNQIEGAEAIISVEESAESS